MPSNYRGKRIVIDTSTSQVPRNRHRPAKPPHEGMVAVTVIAAAALATFLALFVTSRPYDPMNSTVSPQQAVPPGAVVTQPSPKQSPTVTPQPATEAPPQSPQAAGETDKPNIPDDATIQAEIEKVIASDPVLSKLDVSTIVEGGKVTLAGSVKSAELKSRVERAIRSVKGVTGVDNELAVTEATP